MAARLLAVIVAVAMVAVALAVRDRIDDVGGGGDDGRSGPIVVGCITELAAVCEALDGVRVVTEDASTTARRLVEAEGVELDGWITMAPFPAMVDGARARAGLADAFSSTSTVARSPLVVAIWPDRLAALMRHCAGAVGWRCLGDAATAGSWADIGGEQGWGVLKLGLVDPSTTALGLLTLAHATVEWFGTEDISRFDLENDDAYRRWLAGLAAAASTPRDPLATMLSVGPAVLDAAGAVEGPVLSSLDRIAPDRPRPGFIYPHVMATANVVVGAVGARGRQLATQLTGDLEDALQARRWRVTGRPAGVDDAPPLPETNGLPPADVIEAIREVWEEVAR